MPEIEAIEWTCKGLRLLDQTKLPNEQVVIYLDDYRQVVSAIRDMKVRGAPALGVVAAYGLALAASEFKVSGQDSNSLERLRKASEEILKARPTAVNVRWALKRMLTLLDSVTTPVDLTQKLLEEAKLIQSQDQAINRRIGDHGSTLVSDGGSVLTHCNTGALATGGFGTALGIIRTAWEHGKRFDVFHTETRPFLQGARLTAWELVQMGIPGTMVVDAAAGLLLKEGTIQCVVVGADRIAANGDTANKIGTYSLAVIAKENEIPFYVAAPISTVDLSISSGDHIPIEERAIHEVTHINGLQIAASGIGVRNPAFDVTPHKYISAIVTEEGIVREPYISNLASAILQCPGNTG